MSLQTRAHREQTTSSRRVRLQSELMLQVRRYAIARARFARNENQSHYNNNDNQYVLFPGSDDDDPDVRIPRNYTSRSDMHVSAFLDQSINERRRTDPRGRQQARNYREDANAFQCLNIAIFYIRLHLKLFTLILLILYCSYVVNKQNDTLGWLSSRRIGYKEMGTCNIYGQHYGIIETTLPTAINNVYVATMFATLGSNSPPVDADENNIEFCFKDEVVHYNTLELFDGDPNLAKYATESQLQSAIRNNGMLHDYFPSLTGIMVFAHISGLLTLALETFRKGDDPGQFATFNDQSYAQRTNNGLCVLLIIMLIFSGSYNTFMKIENCIISMGISENDASVSDELLYCTTIEDYALDIASVVIPPEPMIQGYRIIVMSLAMLLMVSMAVKLTPGTPRPTINGAIAPGLFELSGNDRRGRNNNNSNSSDNDDDEIERRIRMINVGGAVSNNQQIFQERYNKVANRNKMVKSWKLLEKLPDNDDDRNRCCTVCLEPLFADKEDDSVKRTISWDTSHVESELDLEANIPIKNKSIGGKEVDTMSSTSIKDEHCFELPCHHKYHKSCILEWALNNNTCPECRANLDGSSTTATDVEASGTLVDPDIL